MQCFYSLIYLFVNNQKQRKCSQVSHMVHSVLGYDSDQCHASVLGNDFCSWHQPQCLEVCSYGGVLC